MNADIKQLWIAALRSGEYQQAHGQLRDGDSYCCLGVLCDLHSKATNTPWNGEERYLDEDDVLPIAVVEWAGIVDESHPDNPYAGDHLLAEYNDGAPAEDVFPHSFAEIADLIEQYL